MTQAAERAQAEVVPMPHLVPHRPKEFQAPLGSSPSVVAAIRMAETVAGTDATVVITGESGTGKEVVAQHIHRLSRRSEKECVAVNCSAIPEGLLETELFGHIKGAFTGASDNRKGLVELANRGTLFLDEIGEMPLFMQTKLLRFLQERRYKRVGAPVEVPADIRVIAATNRDIGRLMKEGKFRADLYYRLSVINIDLPPLRERKEDIPLIAKHYLSRFSARGNKLGLEFGQEAMDMMLEYPWPGNIRELCNVAERAAIVCDWHYVRPSDLGLIEKVKAPKVRTITVPDTGIALRDLERRGIEMVLEQTRGNKTAAAKILEISLKTLHTKITGYKKEDKLRKECA